MRFLLLVALLAACKAMPDEIAVSTFTNEYDYLGGDDLKGLGSQDGTSTGIALTATYKLKPQQVQLVPYAGMRPPELPQLDEVMRDGLQAAAATTVDQAKHLLTDAVEVELPAQAVEHFAQPLLDRLAEWWAWLWAAFVALVLSLLLRRRWV